MENSRHKRTAEKSHKHSREDSHEKEEKSIRTIVKKLIKYDSSSEDALTELFDTLDKGDEIDISGVEDEYIKHKLYKLFKLFQIPHSTGKYIFKFEKPQSYSLKNKIEKIVKRCKKKLNKKSDNESDNNKPLKKFKEEEVKETVVEGLEEGFVGPIIPSELEELKRKKKRMLLEQYNSIFRPKTLLEEHQARMNKAKKPEITTNKADRLNEFMERPFNRDKDLDVTRVMSKAAFKSMRDGGTLESKFASYFLSLNRLLPSVFKDSIINFCFRIS